MTQNRPEVWVVSELYFPEETSTGYFLTGIAEGLAGHFRTGVICSQPTYAARGLRAARSEVRNGVSIFRCFATRLDPKVLPFRLVNLTTISIAVFLEVLFRARRGNTIIVVTNPPTLPIGARLAARLRGARTILLVHDVYPDILSATGMIRRNSVLYKAANRAAALLYRGHERVVVLGTDMQGVVAGKLESHQPPPDIIPNWGDIAAIRPMSGSNNPLRDRLRLMDKFVVQYSGNIGRTHAIETVIAAAKLLKTDDSLRFLFIGSGARRRDLERGIERGELPNVTLLPPVPREELAVSLGACDVALVTLAAGMTGLSVPSRIYNILAAGKPMIAMADPDSEVGRIVREEQIGWLLPPGDANALAETIRAARQDGDRLGLMGRRARVAAESRYSRDRVIESWVRLVSEVRAKVRASEVS